MFGYWVRDPERYGVANFDASGKVVGLEAVSYTHLDVYKRQQLGSLARNLRIGTLLPSNQASLGRRENCRIKPVRGGLSPFFLKKLKYLSLIHIYLKLLDGLVRYLPEGAQIWVLRTKGSRAMVKESEIMALLRSRRFAPSKTAAWSELYSADRYSRSGIPR